MQLSTMSRYVRVHAREREERERGGEGQACASDDNTIGSVEGIGVDEALAKHIYMLLVLCIYTYTLYIYIYIYV